MTVCGIKQADGVCVMGKCPYVKMCCPAVWDKSVKPMTNEEWFCQLPTEEKAEFLKKIIQSCGWCLDGGNPPYCLLSGNKCFFNGNDFVEWLKQPHQGGES